MALSSIPLNCLADFGLDISASTAWLCDCVLEASLFRLPHDVLLHLFVDLQEVVLWLTPVGPARNIQERCCSPHRPGGG